MSVVTSKSKDLNQKIMLIGYLLLTLGSFLLAKSLFSLKSWIFVFFGFATWNSLRRFSYAFWPMSFFTVFFLLFSLIEIDLSPIQLLASIIIVLIYLAICWSFFNPILYPVINWYEYDFRFRH